MINPKNQEAALRPHRPRMNAEAASGKNNAAVGIANGLIKKIGDLSRLFEKVDYSDIASAGQVSAHAPQEMQVSASIT